MPDPTVRGALLAKLDELTARMATLLDEIKTVTEQLHPERARSCRNAITMASVMIDEIRLRAHARPLEQAPDIDNQLSTPSHRPSANAPGAMTRLTGLLAGGCTCVVVTAVATDVVVCGNDNPGAIVRTAVVYLATMALAA